MFATNSPLSTLPADTVREIYSHLDFPTKFSFGSVTKFTAGTFEVKKECVTFLQRINREPKTLKISDVKKAYKFYQMYGPGLLPEMDDCGYSSYPSYRGPNPIPRADPGYYYSWKGDAGPMLAEHNLALKQLGIK